MGTIQIYDQVNYYANMCCIVFFNLLYICEISGGVIVGVARSLKSIVFIKSGIWLRSKVEMT